MTKKGWDSDWIHFSKRARRGVIVLIVVFVSIAVSPRLYYNYIYTPKKYDVKSVSLHVKEGKKEVDGQKNLKKARYQQPVSMFNPNTYSLEEWVSVGLSEKQSASILKYLKSGARFRIKSDLKKLYVIDEELYTLLEPKVDLPDSLVKSQKTIYTPKEQASGKTEEESDEELPRSVVPISINTASAWELKSIPGIGSYFAKEIIKTRELYGGIISYDQLFDIYLMDEEKLNAIKPFLVIKEDEIKKLNINSASEKELRNHPLISYDIAKSIVFYRENHKLYKKVDEILLSPYIDLNKFKALKPYLKVE